MRPLRQWVSQWVSQPSPSMKASSEEVSSREGRLPCRPTGRGRCDVGGRVLRFPPPVTRTDCGRLLHSASAHGDGSVAAVVLRAPASEEAAPEEPVPKEAVPEGTAPGGTCVTVPVAPACAGATWPTRPVLLAGSTDQSRSRHHEPNVSHFQGSVRLAPPAMSSSRRNEVPEGTKTTVDWSGSGGPRGVVSSRRSARRR